MKLSDCKVGMRVRLTNNNGMGAQLGAEAVIVSVGDRVTIEWVRSGLDRGQCDGGYEPERFEPVKFVMGDEVAVGGTTAGRIREAAWGSGDAEKVLKGLFPKVFEEVKVVRVDGEVLKAIQRRIEPHVYLEFAGKALFLPGIGLDSTNRYRRLTYSVQKDSGGLWVLIPEFGGPEVFGPGMGR